MKKTLAAVAVLGAFAGSAMAADVTLYGIVDTGLNWTQTKTTGADTTNTFSMGSGQNSGSRFGLKGTENLGDGYKVGFILENSFKSDTGSLDKGSRLFHRESLLYVTTPFGELSFGRTGALDASAGRYTMLGSGATAMSTGWDNVGKSNLILKGTADRMDNTVTYATPTFGGFTVYAQASLKKDSVDEVYKDDQEGSSDAERYYGLAAKYAANGLNAGLIVSESDYARTRMTKDDDDGYTVSGYVNYDFGVIKPMLAAQYWDGGIDNGSKVGKATYNKTKGYGVVIGATAPVLGGTIKATAGWNDFEATNEKNVDGNNWMIGLGYEYKLSKRTFLYTAAGYSEQKEKDNGDTSKVKTTEVLFGLCHSF